MDRSLPSDVEAERAALGSVFLNKEAYRVLSVILSGPGSFYLEKHGWIYEAMQSLYERGIALDTTTIADELRRRERLEPIGGLLYLIELANNVPTSSHADHYADIVERTHLLRELITIGGTIAASAFDERDDVLLTIGKARELVQKIEKKAARRETRYTPETLAALLKEVFSPVNYLVKDLLTEGLTLLCGKPKQGKSWLALDLALAVAYGGMVLGSIKVEAGDVLYLALEDNKRRLQRRVKKLLSDNAKASERFQWQTEWPSLNEGGLTLLEQWLESHPEARLIVIDTLAKVKPRRNSRKDLYAEDYDDVQGLKALCDKHEGLTILVITHLRKAEAEDPLDAITGSTGLVGGVDGAMVLQRERGAGDAVLYIVGRDLEEDKEIALAWSHHSATWSLLGDAEVYRQSNERIEVLEVLQGSEDPLRIRDIAEAVMKPYANVAQLLKRMADEGMVKRTDRGLYSLAEHARKEAPVKAEDEEVAPWVPSPSSVGQEWLPPNRSVYGNVLDQVDVASVCRWLANVKIDDPSQDQHLRAFGTHCTLRRVDPKEVMEALRAAKWDGSVNPPQPRAKD